MGARYQREFQHRCEPRASSPRDYVQWHVEGRSHRRQHRRNRPSWAVDHTRDGAAFGGSSDPRRDRASSRRRRRVAHPFDVEHASLRPSPGRSRSRRRRLRDAEGSSGRRDARAPRVDSDPRKRPGHGAASRSRCAPSLIEHPGAHAFLLRRHGMYTWGETLSQAVRHVEIVEFLLEAVARSERGGTTWP